jgi:aldose 1-epimerase
MNAKNLISVCMLVSVSACGPATEPNVTQGNLTAEQAVPDERIRIEQFGELADGRPVQRFFLQNRSGASVAIMELGATITHLQVPDRSGQLDDVVLGFDVAQRYLSDSPYFGAVVGRYGNRIAKGRFKLDGETYQLALNNAPNSLHGGEIGFDKRIWVGQVVKTTDGEGVRFSLRSGDGDEGYPGALDASVTYVWTEDNRLIIDYEATSDAATVVNLTQHSYFNLAGHDAGSILDHTLTVDAARFTPVDAMLIPTGELRQVADTPFDFRVAKPIGRDIEAKNEQLRIGGGYDHNFVLRNRFNPGDMQLAAVLVAPSTGRMLMIETDQPGLQFYSGNFLDGSVTGKGGASYEYRGGLCLETQHFPDSPNRPEFPSTRLDSGKKLKSRTIFAFSIAD